MKADRLFNAPKMNPYLHIMVDKKLDSYSRVEETIAIAIRDFYHTFDRTRSDLLPIKWMFKVCNEANSVLTQYEIYKNIRQHTSHHKHNEINLIIDYKSSVDDGNVFGYGVITNDVRDGDNDCFTTAGGYRSYLTKAGEPFFVSLDADNNLFIRYDSSLVFEHYNNNIAGVPTGNGDTEYEYGKQIVRRGRKIALLDLLNSEHFKLQKLDTEKISKEAENRILKLINE